MCGDVGDVGEWREGVVDDGGWCWGDVVVLGGGVRGVAGDWFFGGRVRERDDRGVENGVWGER